MNQISEYSEAGITVRGTYYPPGKEPKSEDDEKKLYLAIEATSEISLQKAKYEIKRIIREELLRLVSLTYALFERFNILSLFVHFFFYSNILINQ